MPPPLDPAAPPLELVPAPLGSAQATSERHASTPNVRAMRKQLRGWVAGGSEKSRSTRQAGHRSGTQAQPPPALGLCVTMSPRSLPRGRLWVMQAFELPAAPLRVDEHGVIRVAGSRVTLDSVVAAFERGATAEEIVQSFPTIALEEVYAVLAYVMTRSADVNAYLERRGREEQAAQAEVEHRSPSADFRARLLARRGGPAA